MITYFDAMKEFFEEVTVLGKPMLFSCIRIDRSTVPKGMYLYEVRHDDECQGDPCEIANSIWVNHWGTLITNEPLPINKNNAYIIIDSDKDWAYEGVYSTLKEYMDSHPPKKKLKEIER